VIQIPQNRGPVAVDTLLFPAMDLHAVQVNSLYTCPAGRVAKVIYAGLENTSGALTADWCLTRAAASTFLRGAYPNNTQTFGKYGGFVGPIWLEPGDSFGLNVTVSGAGITADVSVSVEEYST
jgi:hypothetical protein